MMIKKHIVIVPLSNTYCDVFYGDYGWEANEWIRMTKKDGKWIPARNPQFKARKYEVEFGVVTSYFDVAAKIQDKLNGGSGK